MSPSWMQHGGRRWHRHAALRPTPPDPLPDAYAARTPGLPPACSRRPRPAPHPYGRHAVPFGPGPHQRAQRVGGGEALRVLRERREHLGVCVEHLADDVGTHPRAHPRGRRCYQPLDVELIGIDEQPHHRHLIVGLVRDVGQDDETRPGHPGIDALGDPDERLGGGRWPTGLRAPSTSSYPTRITSKSIIIRRASGHRRSRRRRCDRAVVGWRRDPVASLT